MVERTALEMRHTCKGIVGSNPTLSAILNLGYQRSSQHPPPETHAPINVATYPGDRRATTAALACAELNENVLLRENRSLLIAVACGPTNAINGH